MRNPSTISFKEKRKLFFATLLLLLSAIVVSGLNNNVSAANGWEYDTASGTWVHVGEEAKAEPAQEKWVQDASGNWVRETATPTADVAPAQEKWVQNADGVWVRETSTPTADVAPAQEKWVQNADGVWVRETSTPTADVAPAQEKWVQNADGVWVRETTATTNTGGGETTTTTQAQPGADVTYAPPASKYAPAPPAPPAAATNSTTIQISNEVVLSGAQRLGINIGSRNQYGAAQYIKNLVPNPGFEAAEFAMVVHVLPDATSNSFQADNWETNWNNDQQQLGHLPGFWTGANFEVVTGNAKGQVGQITNFTHAGGRYTFSTTGGSPIGQDDIVIVRKTDVSGYNLDVNPNAKAVVGNVRPGSPGKQSIQLTPKGGLWQPAWDVAFDSMARDVDNSAGKLLQIRGEWHFEVWASGQPGTKMKVTFRRPGEMIFLEEEVSLKGGWEKVSFDFSVSDQADAQIVGVPSPLKLELGVSGNVLVDDITLHRSDYNNPTVFTDTFVQKLRELRPGILRNWGAQMGSSLNNQLAGEFSRKPTNHTPKQRIAKNFHYSVHEFLALSKTVGADPWYVIPTNWSDAEIQNFMAYLSAPAGSHPYANIRASLGQDAPWTSQFGRIHLEFGNELWGANFGGDPFLGASLRGGLNTAAVANDRLGALKASPYYNAGKFNTIIGGQAKFPGRQQELEDYGTEHDSIGFAPYYGEIINFNGQSNQFNPLYGFATDTMSSGFMSQNRDILQNAGNGTDMAIYEINVHALKGVAPTDIRNNYLTSQGAGISVPLTMLSYQRDMGIRHQVGFQALQYATIQAGNPVSSFGMLRDIEATARKRPTWLGMELANKAIGGDMLAVNQTGTPTYFQGPLNDVVGGTQVDYVETFAFKQGGKYTIVLFNVDINRSHAVKFQLPSAPTGGVQLHTLYTEDIYADNETGTNVGIHTQGLSGFGNGYNMTLAPHAMYVIEYTAP